MRRVLAGHARRGGTVRRRSGRLPALSAGRGQASARKPEGGGQGGGAAQAGTRACGGETSGAFWQAQTAETVTGETRQEYGCAAGGKDSVGSTPGRDAPGRGDHPGSQSAAARQRGIGARGGKMAGTVRPDRGAGGNERLSRRGSRS